MPFEVDTPVSLERESDFVSVDGNYHVIVIEATERPKGRNGNELKFQVLAGTVPDQVEKTFREMFWEPKIDPRTGKAPAWQVKNCNRRNSILLVAAGLVNPRELGGHFSGEWSDFKNRQFIVSVKVDEGGYAKVDGDCIYHIDDPRVASVPKDEDAFFLEGVVRRKPADFAGIAKPGESVKLPEKTPLEEIADRF